LILPWRACRLWGANLLRKRTLVAMRQRRQDLVRTTLTAACAAVLAACGSTTNISQSGVLQIPSSAEFLAVSDVEQIIAQANAEAVARGKPATIAVVDRVGNVLGIFQTTNAQKTFTINGGRGAVGGLEGISVLPSEAAAIAKALTATYFSSAGNAFSSRTAGQIIQQNFNPGQTGAPAGPLFDVQFSQLSCSDISKQATAGSTTGPHRSPLGFAAQPGGMPLYKNGTVVGAIGVIADGVYSLITNYITDTSPDVNELIAVAGTAGFQAPTSIRADHITAGGITLIFDTSEALMSDPANAPSFASINGPGGAVDPYPGFFAGTIVAGQAYGAPGSGVVPDTTNANTALAGTGDYILVDDSGNNRFPPSAGTDGLMTQGEVTQILASTLQVANQTRAQVRQPLGSIAQVSVTVVDTNGNVVGYVRSPDALVDSVDVVQQKARTAMFFSSPTAASQLMPLPPANYLNSTASASIGTSSIAAYVTAAQTFFGNPNAFADGTAFSTRSFQEISTPFFPDGIPNTPNGPFAKPDADWSIFNIGLELDLVLNKFVAALPPTNDTSENCTGISQIRNGITSFAGGFPIYRGTQLVGGIGVSGDGTDQSDFIGFIGLANAGKALGTGIGHAPPAMRADRLTPLGTRLRYVNCPQTPYVNSNAQNVCEGL
jgi:uncharacterized protein GlcG (DUF336 family)